jgi:hypothetical protein
MFLYRPQDAQSAQADAAVESIERSRITGSAVQSVLGV